MEQDFYNYDEAMKRSRARRRKAELMKKRRQQLIRRRIIATAMIMLMVILAVVIINAKSLFKLKKSTKTYNIPVFKQSPIIFSTINLNVVSVDALSLYLKTHKVFHK